jgi:hypothetical protein
VVVDPLHDTATLPGLTLAQDPYDVPLAAAEEGEDARRRRRFRLEVEATGSVQANLDAIRARRRKRLIDGHRSHAHLRRFV